MKKLLVIWGFRKCGTTYLYDLLHKFSNVSCNKYKETHFWMAPSSEKEKYMKWYLNGFDSKKNTGIFLESSTMNHLIPDLKDQVSTLAQEIVFLRLTRDPAKRFISAYNHMHSQKLERRSLEKVLDDYESSSLSARQYNFEHETELLRKVSEQREIDSGYFNEEYVIRQFNYPFRMHAYDRYFMYRYLGEGVLQHHSLPPGKCITLEFDKLVNNNNYLIEMLRHEGIVFHDDFIQSTHTASNESKGYSINIKQHPLVKQIIPLIPGVVKKEMNFFYDKLFLRKNKAIDQELLERVKKLCISDYSL